MAEPTSELDTDFAAFRAAVLPYVTPAGPDAVRRRVRRRRRTTLTSAVAAAVMLVVGPAAGYAALHQPPRPPDPVVVTTPTEEPTPSPTPSASPSPSASTTTPAAPDGRISRAELLRARLNLPSWAAGTPSCGRSGVRLTAKAVNMGEVELAAQQYADVDDDGAEETVTILGCRVGEAAHQQVVVFDRDAQARIVTLGRVVRTETLDPKEGKVAWITDLRTGSPGTLQVRVADRQPCCDTPKEWAQFQWRTYRWTGHRFTQTGGPRSFGPNPNFTDLAVTGATDVVLTARDTETRAGTTTVTVRNAGRTDARHAVLILRVPAGFGPDGTGWSACAGKPAVDGAMGQSFVQCDLGVLAAGQTRTLTLGLVGPVGSPTSGTAEALIYDVDAEGRYLPDHEETNNHRSFGFR